MHSNIFVNNGFYRTIFIILFITSIGGCAGHKSARDVATLTAKSMNELKQENANFFEEADALALDNEVRLQRLNQQTLALRLDIGIASSAWAIAKDERASSMFAAMTKVESNEVGAQSLALTLLQPAPDIPKNSFNPAQYDDLVKRLNGLAAKSSFTDAVSTYIEFGKIVDKQLKEDSEKAKKGLQETDVISDNKVISLLPKERSE